MARQLLLLRHGEAEPHGTRSDELRSLTERGRRQSLAAGRALVALDLVPHAVYASPRVRALDTARLACEAFATAIDPKAHEPLSAGFDVTDALELLRRHGGEEARVMAVGHEPDFTQLIGALTGGNADLKKGGLAVVRVGGAGGELAALLRPKELALIAGAVSRAAV